jgi:membrane protease YdiL (CAAX protease family)
VLGGLDPAGDSATPAASWRAARPIGPAVSAGEERRPASLRLLVCALAAYSLAHLFNNTVFELGAPRRALTALQSASGGWIEPVLLRSQVVLAAFLAVVVVLGRVRMAELGWRARDLVPGLAVYASAWLVLQLGLAACVLRQGSALAWHPMWARFGAGAVLGGVLAQGLGHALVEDTAFRGFFLPELRARLVRPGTLLAVLALTALAVLGSALLFGLAHLPTRVLVKGSGLAAVLREQGHFLSAGIALGLAYLATRNLFTVIGLHVLLNDPAPAVAVPGTVLNRATLVVFGGVIALSLAGRLRRERMRRARAAELGARRAA